LFLTLFGWFCGFRRQASNTDTDNRHTVGPLRDVTCEKRQVALAENIGPNYDVGWVPGTDDSMP
jgi:hypothetical protein